MFALRHLAAATLLALAATPAYAGPFEDAHQSLIDGKLDDVLLTISVGAIAANTQDEQGYTLLHYAAQLGALDAVKALIERGADPATKGKDGKTALDLATDPAVRAELAAAAAHPAS